MSTIFEKVGQAAHSHLIEGTRFGLRGRAIGDLPASGCNATVVELAVRRGDGLEVALFWNRLSGSLWVDVLHIATGETLTVGAEPAEALDVYYHPFAYCLASAA